MKTYSTLAALPLISVLSLSAPAQAEPIHYFSGAYHYIVSGNPVARMIADYSLPAIEAEGSGSGLGNGSPSLPPPQPIAAVPEPGTLALLGAGILGLMMIRVRERRQAGRR